MNRREKITIWSVLAVGVALAVLIFASNFHLFWGSDENEFDDVIWATAHKYQIDPLLIKAIIKKESSFKYYVRGGKGEIGLMQLMPGAIKDWERVHKKNVASFEVFLPALNIEIGTWYFSQAYKKWSKSTYQISYALAEYNAGGGNLQKWIKEHGEVEPKYVIRFPSTLNYSQKIIGFYNYYLEAAGLVKYVEKKADKKLKLKASYPTNQLIKKKTDILQIPSNHDLKPKIEEGD